MSISDYAYGTSLRFLGYKLKEQVKKLIRIDRWFPCPKKCSCCSEVKVSLDLSERIFRCEVCGMTLDRDRNSCLTIRNGGIRFLLI